MTKPNKIIFIFILSTTENWQTNLLQIFWFNSFLFCVFFSQVVLSILDWVHLIWYGSCRPTRLSNPFHTVERFLLQQYFQSFFISIQFFFLSFFQHHLLRLLLLHSFIHFTSHRISFRQSHTRKHSHKAESNFICTPYINVDVELIERERLQWLLWVWCVRFVFFFSNF